MDPIIFLAVLCVLFVFIFFKVPRKIKDPNLISNISECRKAIKELKKHCREFSVLGFDCEYVCDWKGRRPVALLQLQSYQGLCLLIRLPYVGIIWELKELLEDRRILKVGVGVDLDARYLREDYDVDVQGTFDLRYMAALAKCEPGRLAAMSKAYLNIELDKGEALSDWDASKFSIWQINYAMKDVYVAIELFKLFLERIYDGWMPRTDKEKVQYVINRYCVKFLDLFYNGCQGTPHHVIHKRLFNY